MSALAAAAVPESSDVDDGTPPGMLEVEGGVTLIQTSAPPKPYLWYQPFENFESVHHIMVQQFGCTLEDDQRSKRNEAALKWIGCVRSCELRLMTVSQ